MRHQRVYKSLDFSIIYRYFLKYRCISFQSRNELWVSENPVGNTEIEDVQTDFLTALTKIRWDSMGKESGEIVKFRYLEELEDNNMLRG